MQKQYLINEIKSILKNWGGFGTGEVEADCSPCVDSRGNLVHLAERFDDKVTVIVYYDEVEVDEYQLDYSELETETLQDILNLCIAWKEYSKEEESKTVTITVDRTYYKSATIEVQVPKDLDDEDLRDFLTEDADIDAQIEDAIGDASLNGGETEYHYQDENGFGGHL